MSAEEQKARFRNLDEWFTSDLGARILQAFSEELLPIKEILTGNNLIQFGCYPEQSFHSLRYGHKWAVTPYASANSHFISSFNHLGIDRHSVDCVLAPLTLEAFANKSELLDEIDRILKPLGHVVFFGINPFSLWGLWLWAAHPSCFGEVAFQPKPKSVISLKLAMMHRGYVQCHLSEFYYAPPVKTKKWLEKFEFFNTLGKMISPLPAGFYCFVVQKYQENSPGRILPVNKNYITNVSRPLQPTCRKPF